MPDLHDESDNIQDVGFGARETQVAMNETRTLLKEMVGLLRDMNQRQASLGTLSIIYEIFADYTLLRTSCASRRGSKLGCLAGAR
jgi:hypothetical protein